VAKKPTGARLRVEYENGAIEHIYVPAADLRRGEHIIARERQDNGEIPNGKISRVIRVR
jgi:hypothetical protein